MAAVELLNVLVLLCADGATNGGKDELLKMKLLLNPRAGVILSEPRNFNIRIVAKFVESAVEVESERRRVGERTMLIVHDNLSEWQ